MTVAHSPLRYPGGKQILGRVLAHLVDRNTTGSRVYAEPYAGGAGAALQLLFEERVDRIEINDADLHVTAFWQSILDETDQFLERLNAASLTVEEWLIQRTIYRNAELHSSIDVGFATFYLNRCNRSGIIGNGGVIGGIAQTGNYKMNARFNRDELTYRIKRIKAYRSRIRVSNLDAIDFLRKLEASKGSHEQLFVYLDPPYYMKGQQLYLNYYEHSDHQALANYLSKDATFSWVLTYDKAKEIEKLYRDHRKVTFSLGYSARKRMIANELMILKPGLNFPRDWRKEIPSEFVSSSASTRIEHDFA